MRADRLLSLLLFLQSRGKVTAAQVAEELGISIATARRDLEALSTAGVPIYVQPGRGGGWQLVGGSRTNLTGLSGHEARALFWMLGTAGLSGPGTRVATRKLIHALPESLRAEAETLATTIHYDHTSWGEVRVPDPRSSGDHISTDDSAPDQRQDEDERDHLEALRSALIQHRSVHLRYTRGNGSTSVREVRPLGLVAKVGRWYLVARGEATRDEEVRTYRVDRIDTAVLAEEAPGTDAEEFDLVAYWNEHIQQIEEFRSSVAGIIRAPEWTRPILENHFGSYMTVTSNGSGVASDSSEDTAPEGHFIAEVRANLIVALAEQLAGWGRQIEVLEPPEVRRELGRIGAELSALYGGRDL